MDWIQMTLERHHNISHDWKWVRANREGPEGYIKVQGAVPVGTYKSGPRAGRPKFPPDRELATVWIKQDEIDETKQAWKDATGKCAGT